jgi:FRG domain
METKTLPKIEYIQSLTDFIVCINTRKSENLKNENKVDLLFRGQIFDKPLVPKIGRLSPKGDLANIEKLIFSEFLRTGQHLLDSRSVDISDPKLIWNQLAAAQHHGLATRLLDWSSNALTALWFSLEHFKENETAVVWMFSPAVDDYLNGTEFNNPFENKARTRVFRPPIVSVRIAAQQGSFTAHQLPRNKEGEFLPLEKNANFKEKLVCLRIEDNYKEKIKEELTNFGINSSVLFPDLDGVCSHLNERYFHI